MARRERFDTLTKSYFRSSLSRNSTPRPPAPPVRRARAGGSSRMPDQRDLVPWAPCASQSRAQHHPLSGSCGRPSRPWLRVVPIWTPNHSAARGQAPHSAPRHLHRPVGARSRERRGFPRSRAHVPQRANLITARAWCSPLPCGAGPRSKRRRDRHRSSSCACPESVTGAPKPCHASRPRIRPRVHAAPGGPFLGRGCRQAGCRRGASGVRRQRRVSPETACSPMIGAGGLFCATRRP